MKTLKKITFVLILILGTLSLKAQQMPMYTHYMYNTLTVNPAYAGSRDALTITALNRTQWVGFSGAPMTQTLSMHTPLRSENIGLGLSVLNDKIGPTNNTSIFADFAFIMNLTERSKLALGVSAGANIFRADLNSLGITQPNDPVFAYNINNEITPNFGFGAYYSRERFYAGISVPSLIESNYFEISQPEGDILIGKGKRHFFFISGALFHLSPNLDFKPTTLIKATSGAPIQADITASFIIMQKLLLGGMYRTGDAVGALVGLNITDQFHLGCSFDWSYGLKTSKYNQGSYELVLRYDFIFNSKKQIRSPRYF